MFIKIIFRLYLVFFKPFFTFILYQSCCIHETILDKGFKIYRYGTGVKNNLNKNKFNKRRKISGGLYGGEEGRMRKEFGGS